LRGVTGKKFDLDGNFSGKIKKFLVIFLIDRKKKEIFKR